MRRAVLALIGLASVLLLQSATHSATDPVQESLRKLKERVKAAQRKHAPPPAPARAPAPRPYRRSTRSVRNSRPAASSARVAHLPTLKLKNQVAFLAQRSAGTLPNTGDIQVETVNKGRTVYVYFKLLIKSGPDGCATIPNVAPGNYEIMLKGPTLKLPWRRFVEVKPDQVTLVKVYL
jgi:hypothetical protein